MKAAEKSLALAVRNRIRSVCSYADELCQVEIDEMAPATAGNKFVAVVPAGWSIGSVHNTSSGVNDLVYSIDVCVMIRISNTARDRRYNPYLANSTALATECDNIYNAIDWNYTLMAAANTLISTEFPAETQGFIEPLRFAGAGRPRIISGEEFGDVNNKASGLVRVLSFGGARRITGK